MWQASKGDIGSVACLLEDKRAVASIDAAAVDRYLRGSTALHLAWNRSTSSIHLAKHRLLVEAGANPCVQDGKGRTPMQLLQQRGWHTEASAPLRPWKTSGATSIVFPCPRMCLPMRTAGGGKLTAGFWKRWAFLVLVDEYLDEQRAATLLRTRRLVVKQRGVTLSGEAAMSTEDERALAFVVGVEGGCPRDPRRVYRGNGPLAA